MEQKSWMILRVLLNRYYGGVTEEVSQILPASYRKNLAQSALKATNVEFLLAQPLDQIARIHYSWLVPAVQSLPKALRLPTIAALPAEQAQGLCRLLKLSMPSTTPAPPIGQFLLSALYKRVSPEERLPASFLASSSLSPLGEYDKTQLIRLIDLLGLRDLVQEVRLIVNKRQQTAILSCLNEEEKQFFDFYMYKQREKLTVPRFDFTGWTGDCRKLRQQVHQRGLNRLGKALKGQNPDLLWYVLHTLDVGRAAIIKLNYESKTPEEVTTELLRQVIGLINYFNKQE